MSIVWNGLALFFFVSLFMVSVSVFTPKTAFFFKEKTKLRGAILWMSSALVCAVLVNEFGPGFSPEQNAESAKVSAKAEGRAAGLPGYSFRIAENRAGELLAIDCVLAAPVEEPVLRQLALKVFAANKGGTYKETRIRWFLEGGAKGGEPWGSASHALGNWSITIASP